MLIIVDKAQVGSVIQGDGHSFTLKDTSCDLFLLSIWMAVCMVCTITGAAAIITAAMETGGRTRSHPNPSASLSYSALPRSGQAQQ